MDSLTLKIIYVCFHISTVLIQYPHKRRNSKNKIVINEKTLLEKVLTLSIFVGISVIPLVYVFTNQLNSWDFYCPLWVNILGIMLIPAALWLYYRSHTDLGKNWSYTLVIREDHELITNGIYRYIRHPMYSSIWLSCLIQALLLHNYIAGFSGLVTFGIIYFLRVNKEEKMMEKQFGAQYEEFKKRTNRLIPKF